MKTIILENEYVVDDAVENVLEDFPQIFGEDPVKLIGIKHSSFKSLGQYIEKDCKILFSSTFMYKDQLEEYMEKFATLPFKVTFYVHNLKHHIEEWLRSSSYMWDDRSKFLSNLERVFKRHSIYTFEDDYESDEIENNHTASITSQDTRVKMMIGKVEFDSTKKKTIVNRWIRAK